MKTKLFFKWDKGNTSINDNVVRVFKSRNIDYYYDHFFNLHGVSCGSDFLVDVRRVEENIFEIGAKVERGRKWEFVEMSF